jgi:hypothetical protein
VARRTTSPAIKLAAPDHERRRRRRMSIFLKVIPHESRLIQYIPDP